MSQTCKESQSYAYQSLIAHLNAANDRERIFNLVDCRGFLARQADHFGDFGRTSEDVENFLLPNAIAAKDWDRFFQYATIALNLRGMAEDLATPEILTALARTGRGTLAEDSASRIPDPLRRAATRSVLAAELRSTGETFRQMIEAIERDLEAPLPRSTDVQEILRRSDLLASMARQVGPDLESSWPVWIDNVGLSEGETSPVWKAVAEAWIERGDLMAPGLWQVLERVGSSEDLLKFLPERLGALAAGETEALLKRLQHLFRERDDCSRATMMFLGQLCLRQAEAALEIWERWNPAEAISWKPALIEAGRFLFLRMTPERLAVFASDLQNPVASAAVRVVLLEQQRTTNHAAAALSALESVPDGLEKLHWVLRYLTACPNDSSDKVRSQLPSVARYLHEIRYDIPPDDLCRYLDLIGIHFPGKIASQMDLVLWSLGGRQDTLAVLARESRSEVVLDHLIKNVERYAAGVARHQAEGFLVRGRVLIDAACRYYLHHQSLKGLAAATARMLPQEVDELHRSLVPLLSEPELAQDVCSRIVDRRSQLIARLSSRTPPSEVEFLTPSSLYSSLAGSNALREEIAGLKLLSEDPSSFRKLFEQAFESLRDGDDRPVVLLRLGWHSLLWATKKGRSWDPEAVLAMIRKELTFESHERLALLTPDLAALGAQAGGRRALSEVRMAAENLVALETVAWPIRFQVLSRLLAMLPGIFLQLAKPKPRQATRQGRKALAAITRLPERMAFGSVRDEVQAHWHEVLPHIAAAAQRVPEPFIHSVEPPPEPGAEALLHYLWQTSTLKEQADGFLSALGSGGRPAAEPVLRSWLHVHLAPSLGHPQPETVKQAERLEGYLGHTPLLAATRN
jgi:hypothetical protein